jgi:ATP-dependent exoDNAse (exonuclease V) beta subunit
MSGPTFQHAAFEHTVIRASAGTGKTYQLTNRFIGLLAAGIPPERILATTFTRKAAGEILDRVLLRLAQSASDARACQDLAAAIGDKAFTQARARELLKQTARNLHRLRVGTLDSYFLQIAGGFSLELGLPPGWTICDELIDQTIRDEAIEEVLSRGKLAELLTLVNLLAKGEAVRSISRIVQDTVTSLFVLFRQTDAAAWERVPHAKGLADGELVAAIEALKGYSLSDKNFAKARDADLAMLAAADWKEFIGKGIAVKLLDGESTYSRKPIPPDLAAIYQPLLKQAQSVLVGQIAQQTEATHKLLARFAEHYSDLQSRQRALRFDDVTHRLAIAASHADPGQWAFRLGGAIEHLLLDEFQDTAPVQWQVLRPLAQRLTQSSPHAPREEHVTRSVTATMSSSFFCVGDTKQAIYGWRGGLAEIFDALDGELTGLSKDTLAKSYRSSPPVIDTVNRVFSRLTQHPNLDKLHAGVAQWQQQFPEHSTAKTDLSGHVRLEFAPVASENEEQSDRTSAFAAECIARHVAEAPQCSVGVLVRTNAAVARMIFLLRRLGVPASEEGGNPLFDSPAVELVLSVLRLADHPGDKVARFHLASSPLAAALELTNHTDDRAAAHLARRLRRQLLDEGYGPVVFDLARRVAAVCDRRDQSRLQQLVELAFDYQAASTLRTGDFIDLVESRRVADPSSADVRVMTIHQAKGLEFDIVVLPELEGAIAGQPPPLVVGRPGPTQPIDVVVRYASEAVRKFLPPRLQQLFQDDARRKVFESLCVLYVAMTRAVHCLHMIVPPPKASEKSLPKTFAGLLRATLGGGQMAGLLDETGDAKWFSKLPKPAASTAADDPSPASIRLAPPRPDRERGLERTSPSSLEGGRKVAVATLLEAKSDAFEYGSLIHGWMEQLAWFEDGWPADERLFAAARKAAPRLALDDNKLQTSLKLLREQLAAQPIAAVLSRKFYERPANLGFADPAVASWKPDEIELEVQRERQFAVRCGDEILSGSIDRLVLIRRGGQVIAADVLDYKTDAVAPGYQSLLADKTAFYAPQLNAYRLAVSKLYRLDERRITARLVFLGAGTAVVVQGE